jgi:hypothetical protein
LRAPAKQSIPSLRRAMDCFAGARNDGGGSNRLFDI